MELFRELVVWSDFVNTLLTEKISEAEEAEEAYERAFSEALTASRSESVTVAKALATKDPTVKAAKDRFMAVDAERRAFRAYYENLDRDRFFVSREITRRGDIAPHVRRDDRFGGG